jgi:septal ring factor EnvC (AmiA/AmiB activator)
VQRGILTLLVSPSVEVLDRALSRFERVGIEAPESAVVLLRAEMAIAEIRIRFENGKIMTRLAEGQAVLEEQRERIRELEASIAAKKAKIAANEEVLERLRRLRAEIMHNIEAIRAAGEALE